MHQLELFEWQHLTSGEIGAIMSDIRRHYWFVRNSRADQMGWAVKRKHYRKIARQKKRLQLGGVDKREILDLLACCRLQCKGRKHPFYGCKYCP